MARGFYSVVQYCPDRFRFEVVNVGFILFQLEPHIIKIKMTNNFEIMKTFFNYSDSDLINVKFSVDGFEHRVNSSKDEFLTEDDLNGFIASRANDILPTELRLAKITDFDVDFERLFKQIVEREN